MSQENLLSFECAQCRRVTHHSKKNKRKLKERLEMKKFCKFCRKHVMHKETK